MRVPLLARSVRVGLLLTLIALGGSLGVLAAAVTPAPARLAAGTFAAPAFRTMWERTDLLVEQGAVSRTWLWGPTAGLAIREPWAPSPGGQRLVQYFDKGRMEISNPEAPPTDPFYVTNGLLAVELISGQVQTGPSSYTPSAPAGINIAGDRDDSDAPTYASFRAVANMPGGDHRVPDATGQPVNQALTRNGTVGPARQDYGVRAAYYEPITGHNVPDVFWTFLNSSGSVVEGGQVGAHALFSPWFALTGLPISEAYWSVIKIGPARVDVLIQAFERRVLTYAPNNPEGFKVEMGNIGMHYVEWRYGTPNGGGAPGPTPAPAAPPPDVRIQGIANQKGGLDLNSQSVTLLNAGSGPVDLAAWRLLVPHNSYDDDYVFPRFALAAGGQVTLYAGWGSDTTNQLFMHRVTWLFDATPYDGAVLYDPAGREVARYFLTGGAPPTQPPAPGATVPPTATVPGATTPGPGTTETPKPTATVPGPEASGTPSAVASPTPAGSVTATPTPGTPTTTASPTPSVFPSGTPSPHIYSGGVAITAWMTDPFPHVGANAILNVLLTKNGTPVASAPMAALWHYPGNDDSPCAFTSGPNGIGTCIQVVPATAANQTIWIDVAAQVPSDDNVYITYTGMRPQP